MLSGFHKASVLNTTVSSINFTIQSQVKILKHPTLPNQKSISLGRILLGIFTNDRPVFHTPMNGIAVPTLKGFAIEKRFFPEKRKGSEKEQEGQR